VPLDQEKENESPRWKTGHPLAFRLVFERSPPLGPTRVEPFVSSARPPEAGAGRTVSGWLVGSPVLLLCVILAARSGLPTALGTAALVVAGILTLSVLRRVWSVPAPARLAWWSEPAVGGLLVGLACAIAWTVLGGPGWGARLSLLVAVGLWMTAAEMSVSSDGRAYDLAPLVVFFSLLGLGGLGFATGAGVLYFLGQPLAVVVIVAGHFAARATGDRRDSGLARLSFVAAAVVLDVLAWADLV
jgi:hypothetical protein